MHVMRALKRKRLGANLSKPQVILASSETNVERGLIKSVSGGKV